MPLQVPRLGCTVPLLVVCFGRNANNDGCNVVCRPVPEYIAPFPPPPLFFFPLCACMGRRVPLLHHRRMGLFFQFVHGSALRDGHDMSRGLVMMDAVAVTTVMMTVMSTAATTTMTTTGHEVSGNPGLMSRLAWPGLSRERVAQVVRP